MALKDIWTDKTDDIDDILADDINAIANEVISNTENKADKTDIPTKVSQLENDEAYVTPKEIQPIYRDINYLDTQTQNLEAEKADKTDIIGLKASHAWQLIGETNLSEDGDRISVVLPNDITDWYGETLMLIEIPKSETINGTTNGNVSILGRKNDSTVCRIYVTASSSTNYGALEPTWINRWAVITQWFGKKPISTNISRARASATAYSLSSFGTTTFSSTDTIDEATEIMFSSSNEFIFPKGSSFKMYGRF